MVLAGKWLIEHQEQFKKIAAKAEAANRRGNLHSAIAWAEFAAEFAWARHPGFYYDMTLESLLTEIANKINKSSAPNISLLPQRSQNKLHVLHVITGCMGLGGHTLVVTGWIKNTFDTAVHSIVATAQKVPLPTELTSLAIKSGGSCPQLANYSSNLVDRSLLLRQLGTWADLVVIHVNPSDALPNVAFGVEGGPPVIFLNHADDVFWLGVSISDAVLDLHPSGQNQTLYRRASKVSKILPIPLNHPPHGLTYETARKQLGIQPNTTLLLTVARECKYLSIGAHDFLGIVSKIVNKHPNVKLLAAGPENAGRWAKLSLLSGGRIVPMGGVPWAKIHPLYASADIFLDSFPIGTGTAYLEAGLRSVPTIGLQYKEAQSITENADDVAFTNCNVFPSSVEEYTSLLEDMITNPLTYKERARQLKELIIDHHCSPGWNRYLNDVMNTLPSGHSLHVPNRQDYLVEPVNNIVADWDAKVLGNEDVEQTYARMMLSYASKLQKTEMLQEQTINFMSEFPKSKSVSEIKTYLYHCKKCVLP